MKLRLLSELSAIRGVPNQVKSQIGHNQLLAISAFSAGSQIIMNIELATNNQFLHAKKFSELD
jgi:hypothetical protein